MAMPIPTMAMPIPTMAMPVPTMAMPVPTMAMPVPTMAMPVRTMAILTTHPVGYGRVLMRRGHRLEQRGRSVTHGTLLLAHARVGGEAPGGAVRVGLGLR